MKFGRPQLILVFALLVLVGAGGLWQFREYIDREHLTQLVEAFAEMGPWVFFSLMAVLPLFWAPVSPFLLMAPAFGLPVAIMGTLCALTFNIVISWFVSGKWFRPLFVRIVGRFGYSIPVISERSMVGVAIMLRITPGMPFPLQNYLLGLAQMPLGKYLLVSLPIVWTVSASLVVLGESLMTGNGKLAMAGIGLAIAVAVGLRLWRVRLQEKAVLENV